MLRTDAPHYLNFTTSHVTFLLIATGARETHLVLYASAIARQATPTRAMQLPDLAIMKAVWRFATAKKVRQSLRKAACTFFTSYFSWLL